MIDHVAHPSFDVAATHRFYTEVLGASLKAASSGDSPEWKARYLLAAYELEGAEIDFFSYEGIARPPADGLPREIRHAGIALPSQADVSRVRQRLDAQGAEYWIEHHDGPEDEHLYVPDPNGLVIEFSVAAKPWPAQAGALDVVRQWSAAQSK
jgi:glyoxylase I family protein